MKVQEPGAVALFILLNKMDLTPAPLLQAGYFKCSQFMNAPIVTTINKPIDILSSEFK